MMKLFKKNMSHSLLAALLVLFIVFDIKIPNEVAKLTNTLLGRVLVAGGALALLLNDPSEFEGGDLELMAPGKFAELKQGHAICFASFLNHRVQPVTRGMRQSLVVWFGGKPFR